MDYEKLGSFYLGRSVDPDSGETTKAALLYDSKDLTTHAVCVGMTGSGKTGLCVSLLEEAALDGIPAIIIDPKGDIGNLLLTFPQLKPESFAPWVDPGEATRKGFSVEEYAKRMAGIWKDGLASWDQDAARIQTLKDSADFSIYTPGSSAGLPLTVLRSFNAPPEAIRQDTDAMGDRVQGAVSGLLAMLGITADPVRSREHILLSNILHRAWTEGRDLDLAGMIREIQAPPFQKLGVFDLESFYPQSERFELAMTLNNMLASPGFQSWMQGEPLDIQRLLWTAEGKPRVSILSIAHMSESERMFFVTILLNEMVSWMRSQSGTSSLRALLYMDEIFGYFPPTANPPSKKPMLTLLKQARAYGLGCVLATQNPVDLDYKGLSNTGTWFIGRLQTDRDKQRVLDGLEGASSQSGKAFDRQSMEQTLAGLGNRVFLMNNVHDNEPTLFHTRWAMSYLRGPLTRTQIEQLMGNRRKAEEATAPPPAAAEAPPTPAQTRAITPQAQSRPIVPQGVKQLYLKCAREPIGGERLIYRAQLYASCKLHFANATAKVDLWRELSLLNSFPEAGDSVCWDDAAVHFGEGLAHRRSAETGAALGTLPDSASAAKNYKSWERELKSHLYQEHSLTIWKSSLLKTQSEPDELKGDFISRLNQIAREQRDVAVEKLRSRHAPKVARLQDRIRKAQARVETQKGQLKRATLQTAMSFGTTLIGALMGRKALSTTTAGRASTTMNRAARSRQEKADVTRAQADVEALQEELDRLESDFLDAADELKAKYNPDTLELTERIIRPRKTDIAIKDMALAWAPWVVDEDGIAERAF